MIRIKNETEKRVQKFWNHCVFHPTDAVEDPWGKKILDRLAKDGSIGTVRIYTMFEDIVYWGEDGRLAYDWRLSDLRLDYLVEKGFDLFLAYAGIPDLIASDPALKTANAKNKTRYKGKMFNTSPPNSFALWEEMCYEYTKHIVERYGLERVSKWHLHCFNEPDIPAFFLSNLPGTCVEDRLKPYCKLYECFVRALERVSPSLRIGGPALANRLVFLAGFLDYVKEHKLRLDFISLHNYGTNPRIMNENGGVISVDFNLKRHADYLSVIYEKGFASTEIAVDEWGASTRGFSDKEDAPTLMFRETEVFSSYYVKLIRRLCDADPKLSMWAICLSGQHEMKEEFTGFRGFFTLNFIPKPIYTAHLFASRLGEELLRCESESELVTVFPTRIDGGAAALLTYSDEHFSPELCDREEEIVFEGDTRGKTVSVYQIDREHLNPYRLYERLGKDEIGPQELALLRRHTVPEPVCRFISQGEARIPLTLQANGCYFITVTDSGKEVLK